MLFERFIIKRVVTTGLLVASGIESVLRNEFANYTPGDAIEAAIENTLPDGPERNLILEFVKGSPRGIVRGYN